MPIYASDLYLLPCFRFKIQEQPYYNLFAATLDASCPQEAIIYVFTIKEGEAEAERVYIVMTKSVRYRVVAKDGSQYRRGGAKLCNG
jgi:hypothetical protein